MGCNSSKSADGAKSGGGGADDEKLAFLANVPLFKRLPQKNHTDLAKVMQPVKFESGKEIITQGAEGDSFYVIKDGTCEVLINGGVVKTLKNGDYFGEYALIRDEPRLATVKATAATNAFMVTRADFDRLKLRDEIQWPGRGAVGGGAGKVDTKPPCQKSAAEIKLMTDALKANANLKEIYSMDDTKIKAMIEVMWKEDIASGKEVIKQGDTNADYFYIVTKGEFEVLISQGAQSAESATASSMAKIGEGGSFGELALIHPHPRAATVVARSSGQVMVIDRVQFQQALQKDSDSNIVAYIQYLDKVKILEPLKDEEKKELAKALEERTFSKGDNIFGQGEKGDAFFILVQGSVSVIKDGKEAAQLAATSAEPQYFGEQALLNDQPRAATIQVTSADARTLIVDKTSFDIILGPLEELKKRGKTGTGVVRKGVQNIGADGGKRFGNIHRRDLRRLGLLGCGGFGAVEMVEHVKTDETYALKGLSKGYIVKSGMQASVMSEKNVQLLCDSPFIIKLYETFNGEQSLYLLLELALGGELYATYNKKNMWGREDCAKFYVAGTTFAFEHLHSKKIIFRDLKPENLLLNEHGHVKLTDMGLAKVVVGKTYTTCGTPDYFAPELINSKGHNHAVDWWTLGILTFELLSGHPPFESATPMQIYQKVTKGINRVAFPKKCKGPQESFIKGLCHQDWRERLPMKKGETKQIKDHPWYAGFSWSDMQTFKMTPPYKPSVKSKKDVGNFSARKEDMPPQIPYKNDNTGWDKDFATST